MKENSSAGRQKRSLFFFTPFKFRMKNKMSKSVAFPALSVVFRPATAADRG